MNRIKKTLFYFLFFGVTLTILNKVSGESFPEEKRVTLKVAIGSKGYLPFMQVDYVKGITFDILDYISAHSKYNFEYTQVPWPRALVLVANGQLDLLPIFFKTPDREQDYLFIDPPYAKEVNQLFALNKSNIKFDGDFQKLTKYSIGMRREFSYGEAFDHATYLQKKSAVNEEVMLKLLLNELVDIVISNPFELNQLITKYSVGNKVKPLEPYVSVTPVFLALTKERNDAQEVQHTIGKILKQLLTTPYYQTLLKKYQLNY